MIPTELVLHIGTPKTGTTSIQESLLAVRQELLERTGTLLPSVGLSPRGNRHTMITLAAMKGRAMADDMYAQLMAEYEASGASRMLITEETLSIKPKSAEFFGRFKAAGMKVRVVCYLRRWDYFAESAYNQVARMQGFADLPDIDAFIADENRIRRADYLTLLEPWRQLADQMVVEDFQRTAAGGQLLANFSKAAGIEAAGPLPQAPLNISTDTQVLLLMRKLVASNANFRAGKFLEQLQPTAAQIMREGRVRPPKYLIGRRARTAMLAQLTQEAETLADRYGVRFSADMPAGEGDDPLTEPDPAFVTALWAALPADVASTLHGLMQGVYVAEGGTVVEAGQAEPEQNEEARAIVEDRQRRLAQARQIKRERIGGAGKKKKNRRRL